MPANKTSGAPVDYRRMWEDLRDQVRAAWPIDQALRDLKGADIPAARGNDIVCRCPFHDDKSPSFSISKSAGVYMCHTFGCNEKGDLFTLIRDTQSLSFRDALTFGAEQMGIPIPKELATNTWKPSSGRRAAPRTVDTRLLPHADLQPSTLAVIPETLMPRARGYAVLAWNNGSSQSRRGARKYSPHTIHAYRDADGTLLTAILRIQKSDGGKFFVPLHLGDLPADAPRHLDDGMGRGLVVGGSRSGEARPVYGIDRLHDWIAEGAGRILVIEGEKTKDSTQRMIVAAGMGKGTLVLSAMGGGNAVLGADWSPIARALAEAGLPLPKIVAWPDADENVVKDNGEVIDRQDLFAKMVVTGMAQFFLEAGFETSDLVAARIRPPDGVCGGWDLADAEADKWHPDRLKDHLTTRQEMIDMDDIHLISPRPQFSTLSDAVLEVAVPSPFDDADPLDGIDTDENREMFAAIEASFGQWDDLGESPSEEDLLQSANDTPDEDTTDMPSEKMATPDDALPEDALPDDGLPVIDITATDAPAQIGDLTLDDTIPDAVVVRHVADEDIDVFDDGDDGEGDWNDPILHNNPHFRCLGYLEGTNYFLSLNSSQIFALNAGGMRVVNYFHLAPREWWIRHYPSANGRGAPTADWEIVASELVRHSYGAGIWEPERQVGKGARMDRGRVVFHTGGAIWVEGKGSMDLRDFHGENTYTVSKSYPMPSTDDFYGEESDEVNTLLKIIENLDWREDTRALSVMSLFGWIAIAPLSGILEWRSHLWLDGPTSAGKSWIIENLIAPALGKYRIIVKSNSSESGLRNALNGTALPLIFDEAEGEGTRDKVRIEDIMKLARHSASPSEDSVVVQGVPGGGTKKHYSIASMFLLASITPQIDTSADGVRFARAHLSSGLKIKDFMKKVELPAHALFRPGTDGRGFGDKLIGRMLNRAHDYKAVLDMMVMGLCDKDVNRRIADVYGTYVTGAWLALRDGVPADTKEAMAFIVEKFDALPDLLNFNVEVTEDRDHTRIFSEIMSHEMRFDSRNGGQRTERIGSLMRIAAGLETEDDVIVSVEEAQSILINQGLRMGTLNGVLGENETPTHVLIHNKAKPILHILKDTPYAKGYRDVMHHAGDIVSGEQVRFGGNGVSRCLKVPLRHFHIEEPR